MKDNSRITIIVGCLFGFLMMLIPASLIYAAKWQFGRTVIVGTKADEVIAQYGQPVQIFKSGEVLDAWGSGPGRQVKGDTWIYSLSAPFSVRAVVTFENSAVTQVEYQVN